MVLVDPPYALQDLDAVLARLGVETGLIAEGGMVVVGHSRFLELPAEIGCLRRVTHRRYGDNVVEFYQLYSTGGEIIEW